MSGGKLRIALPAFDAECFVNYLVAMHALGVVCDVIGEDCDPGKYDGLLLPGGGDVDPALYGREMQPECEAPDRALDDLQLKVLGAFVKAKKPVLGICRGHQLINVYFGGTLIQHLPASFRHSRMGEPSDKVHPTRTAEGSFIERLYGVAFSTNSSHHQAVDGLGEGLEIVQWAEDGVAEALAHRELPVYGVQWHPERMCFGHARPDTVDGAVLLKWFLDICG